MVRLPLLVMMVAALVAGGCGGDDSDDDAGTTTSRSQPQVETGGTDESERRDEAGDGDAGAGEPGRAGAGSSNPSGRVGRQEYIAAAAQICTRMREEIGRRTAEAAEDFEGRDSQEQFREVGTKIAEARVAAIEEALEELGRERRPSSGGRAIDRYFRAAERYVELLAQQAELVGDPSAESAELSVRITRRGVALRKAARRAGFQICGIL